MAMTRERVLALNLEALGNCPGLASQWLSSPGRTEIALAQAADGLDIIVAGGQSQASRQSPAREAERCLEPDKRPRDLSSLWLFGLGNPYLARAILDRGWQLSLYEPDPGLARAALGIADFSRELRAGALRLVSPWDLAEEPEHAPPAPFLLAHAPSRRRAQAAFLGLRDYLEGRGARRLKAGGPEKFLIIPPFSGGSLSMGPAILEAALGMGLEARLLSWGDDLFRKAEDIRLGRSASGTAAIFREAALQAAGLMKAFRPDMALALAQAPLEAQGLARLKEERPECLLALWFVEDFRLFGYLAQIAPAYDLIFHIQGEAFRETARDWGLRRAWYLPLAADARLFRPRKAPPEFSPTLSFMGAGYPNRRRLLSKLARDYWRAGGRPEGGFRIYGSGWEGAPEELRAHIFQGGRRVSPEECALIYAGSQVSLNIHSGQGQGFSPQSAFVNPRTFEIAAAGGAQVVDWRPLLPDLFQKGEVAAVRQPEELPEAIEGYLGHPGLAREHGRAARARVLGEHLYRHRLKEMFNLAGEER